MLTPLTSLMVKEVRQTFRDPRMLVLLMVAPVVQLVVLGYAVNLEVDRVPTLLADEDHSPASRDLLRDLTAGDTFVAAGHTDSGEDAARAIAAGEVPLALVVPRGYGADLARGRSTQVQVLVDGGDSNRAIVAQNAISVFVLGRSLSQARGRLEEAARLRGAPLQLATIRVEPRILYNPRLQSRLYFVPGVAATLLIIVTLVVTAMGLAREKEMGTLEQMLVTPLTPSTIILGKTLPYAAIAMVDLGLVIVGGAWIFGVPVRGHLGLLCCAGLLYSLTTLGLGLLVSAAVRTQQQAFFAAFLIIMPCILLSGFVTPVENMPTWLQPLTFLDPVRHFMEVMRGVLLKGATFRDLASQLVALAGLGVTVFAGATWLLRRKLG